MAGGLVTSPTNSIAAAVMGIDPEPESELNRAASRMVEGEWLKAGDERGLILGVTLAERLGVGVKSRIVVMAPDPETPPRHAAGCSGCAASTAAASRSSTTSA